MHDSLRIGAVNYLNSKPLIYEFEELAAEADLVLDVPSRLASDLAEGKLDVALVPVVEYFRHPGWSIVPDIAVASQGPVLSVTLFSRQPWPAIRRVALDEGSRTSAALTKILLQMRHQVRPEYIPLPLDSQAESVEADAVLLIGDRAMRACLPGFTYAYDLGQEWHDWTGLPFVYAFWAVREGVDLGDIEPAFQEAKRRGLQNVGRIAQREAPLLGLDAGFCRRYLSNIIRFDLGPREREGLLHYCRLACDLDLARPGVELAFYGETESQDACQMQTAH